MFYSLRTDLEMNWFLCAKDILKTWIHLETISFSPPVASMLPVCLLDSRSPTLTKSFCAGLTIPSQTCFKACVSSTAFANGHFSILILYYLFHIPFPVKIFFLFWSLPVVYLFFSIYCKIILKFFVVSLHEINYKYFDGRYLVVSISFYPRTLWT